MEVVVLCVADGDEGADYVHEGCTWDGQQSGLQQYVFDSRFRDTYASQRRSCQSTSSGSGRGGP